MATKPGETVTQKDCLQILGSPWWRRGKAGFAQPQARRPEIQVTICRASELWLLEVIQHITGAGLLYMGQTTTRKQKQRTTTSAGIKSVDDILGTC
jgi:hypothetical protein